MLSSTSNEGTDLQRRFLRAEKDLLSAITDGPEAVQSFQSSWDTLRVELREGEDANTLNAETIAVANIVANRVEILANSFTELEISAHSVFLDYFPEALSIIDSTAENVLDPLPSDTKSLVYGNEELNVSSGSRGINRLTTHDMPTNVNGMPVYIEKAYHWLLRHLHNPYPSARVKSKIANEAGVLAKTVGDWFTRTRSRIGWTSVIAEHFNGQRAVAVDWAYRVYMGQDTNTHVPRRYKEAFDAIRDRAEHLYDGKWKESDFANSLKRRLPTLSSSSKKRAREMTEDNLSKLVPDDGRCTKRTIRHRSNLPIANLPRSSSISSSSALSVSSTPEPTTPSDRYATLPVIEANDHLRYWLSGVQSQFDADKTLSLDSSLKRRHPDSEYASSMKRARYNTQSDLQSKDALQSAYSGLTSAEDIDIQGLSQFDFNFPPVACLSYILPECDTVQLNSFSYSMGDAGSKHVSLLTADAKENLPESTSSNSSLVTSEEEIENGSNFDVNSFLDGFFNLEETVGPTSTHEHGEISSDPSPASFELVEQTQDMISEDVGHPDPSPGEVLHMAEQELLDSEHLTKLERINYLLMEASKLQKEVFG